MNVNKMKQAEDMRYAKIERLIDLLCSKKETVLEDNGGYEFNKQFKVGKRISVEGGNIIIKNKAYDSSELKKITINTEGSLSIYDRSGRKLCGWIDLNLSTKNIELFCIWARRNNVPAEVVSGKGERIFQLSVFVTAILVLVLFKILHSFC